MSRRTAVLVSWFCIQILTLAFGAMRLPLSARAGYEPQSLALPEMVVVQLAIGTLLFPVLFSDGLGLAAVLSVLAFLQLAGLLTATPLAKVGMLGLGGGVWLGGLWIWRAAISNQTHRLIGVAVLGSLVIGLPVARYLVSEFADSDSSSVGLSTAIDPLTCLLGGGTPIGLAAPGILVASAALALALRKKYSSRQVIHKLFHISAVVKSGKPTQ